MKNELMCKRHILQNYAKFQSKLLQINFQTKLIYKKKTNY